MNIDHIEYKTAKVGETLRFAFNEVAGGPVWTAETKDDLDVTRVMKKNHKGFGPPQFYEFSVVARSAGVHEVDFIQSDPATKSPLKVARWNITVK